MDKLELLGAEFLSQYVAGRYAQELRERSYRIYVTDSLEAIANNSALLAGAWGCKGAKLMEERWADLFKPRQEESGGKIAAKVILGAGLKIKQNTVSPA